MLLAVGVVTVGVVAPASADANTIKPASSAAPTPPAAVTKLHIALWKGALNFQPKFPQSLVADKLTTSFDVHQLDAQAVCQPGVPTWYQADIYVDNAATTELLKKDLDGTGEQWPGGSYKSEYSNVFSVPACAPPVVVNTICTTFANGGTSTDKDANGWVSTDTRSTGHAAYVAGGLKVSTEGATSTDKVAWGHPASGLMSNTGVVAMDYTADFGIRPGIQLSYNFGADGNGTLVQEDVYGTGTNQDLWLTNGSSAAVKANAPVIGGGNGSPWHGTINQWLAKYPTATLTGIGFSGGSGVYFSGVIHSITVGCTTYKFDLAPVVVVPDKPAPVVTTASNDTVDCTTSVVTTQHSTTTTDYTYNSETNTWVKGQPTTVKDADTTRAATVTECPTPVILVDPEVVQPVCATSDGTATSGYITVVPNENVVYTITGSTDNDFPVNVANAGAKTELAPGTYVVTAKAAAGFALAGDDVGPWTRIITAVDGCLQAPTLGLIPTGVTSTNQVCTSGAVNGGSGTITVGQVDGADFFNVGVDYFINGTKVTTKTSTHAAGTYTVTAVADPNGDAQIQDGYPAAFTVTIAAPAASCGELTTLAYTGGDGKLAYTGSNGTLAGGLLFGLVFLLLGAGAVTVSQVRKRNS